MSCSRTIRLLSAHYADVSNKSYWNSNWETPSVHRISVHSVRPQVTKPDQFVTTSDICMFMDNINTNRQELIHIISWWIVPLIFVKTIDIIKPSFSLFLTNIWIIIQNVSKLFNMGWKYSAITCWGWHFELRFRNYINNILTLFIIFKLLTFLGA